MQGTLTNQINQITPEYLEIIKKTKLDEGYEFFEKSTKALSSITKNRDLEEVERLKNPPSLVRLVAEALLTFMGISDKSWENYKKLAYDKSFFEKWLNSSMSTLH